MGCAGRSKRWRRGDEMRRPTKRWWLGDEMCQPNEEVSSMEHHIRKEEMEHHIRKEEMEHHIRKEEMASSREWSRN